MKLFRLFGLLSIIALLVVSQSAFVNAETFTREFRDIGQSYSPTDKRFSNDVIATIQTEPDGSWFIGNTYQVTYTIRVSYVNETLYDLESFTLHCYDSRAIQYQTDATFQNSGTLTFNITADATMGNMGIDQGFSLTVYDDGETITGGSWFPSMYDEPIRINVVNRPTATPSNISAGLFVDPLFVAMICVFLIILVAVIFVAYKIGKKNRLR